MKAITLITTGLLMLACQGLQMVIREADVGNQFSRKYGEQTLAFTVPQYSIVAFRPNPKDDTYNGKDAAEQRQSMDGLIHFFGGAVTTDCPMFTLEDEPGYVVDAVDAVNERPKVRKVTQGHIRYVNQTGTYIFDNRPDDRKKPYGIIVSNGIDAPRVFWGTRSYLKQVKRMFRIADYSAFQDSVATRDRLWKGLQHDAPAADSSMASQQAALDACIDSSLTIAERRLRGETVDVDNLVAEMLALVNRGAAVGEAQLLRLVTRDGGGWTEVAQPEVLRFLLTNYSHGPSAAAAKSSLLNRLFCRAVLLSDPGVVKVLIDAGANPTGQEIKETLQHITPDYFPTYESIRLLEDELGINLYRLCRITPLWWLVLERAQHPERRDAGLLSEAIRKRSNDATKVCNVEMESGYLLDPEIYPAELNAWGLAEKFGDEGVLTYLKTPD